MIRARPQTRFDVFVEGSELERYLRGLQRSDPFVGSPSQTSVDVLAERRHVQSRLSLRVIGLIDGMAGYMESRRSQTAASDIMELCTRLTALLNSFLARPQGRELTETEDLSGAFRPRPRRTSDFFEFVVAGLAAAVRTLSMG